MIFETSYQRIENLLGRVPEAHRPRLFTKKMRILERKIKSGKPLAIAFVDVIVVEISCPVQMG